MLDEAAVSYQLVLTKADKVKPTELAEDARADDRARRAKHPAAHPRHLHDVERNRRGHRRVANRDPRSRTA